MNVAKAGMLGAKMLGGSALGSPAVGALANQGIKLAGIFSGPLSGGFVSVLATVSKFALGLSLAGVAITAVILIVQNWDKIMQFVHDNAGFFIVQASKLANTIDYLGQVFNICSTFASTFTSALLKDFSKLPIFGDMAKGLSAAMKTSAADQAAAEANLRSKGLGGTADSIKGSSPAEMAKGSKPAGGNSQQKNSTVVNQTNNFSVQQVPGHDHEKCMRTMVKGSSHAASAGSGNSVGRSMFTHGHQRP
jgi:hypothetical protein